MDDDRLERLLKGYGLPEVPPGLDQRVLREGGAMVARARFRDTAAEVGHSLLHRFGFGYLAWAMDVVTTTDAEYRVELI